MTHLKQTRLCVWNDLSAHSRDLAIVWWIAFQVAALCYSPPTGQTAFLAMGVLKGVLMQYEYFYVDFIGINTGQQAAYQSEWDRYETWRIKSRQTLDKAESLISCISHRSLLEILKPNLWSSHLSPLSEDYQPTFSWLTLPNSLLKFLRNQVIRVQKE